MLPLGLPEPGWRGPKTSSRTGLTNEVQKGACGGYTAARPRTKALRGGCRVDQGQPPRDLGDLGMQLTEVSPRSHIVFSRPRYLAERPSGI